MARQTDSVIKVLAVGQWSCCHFSTETTEGAVRQTLGVIRMKDTTQSYIWWPGQDAQLKNRYRCVPHANAPRKAWRSACHIPYYCYGQAHHDNGYMWNLHGGSKRIFWVTRKCSWWRRWNQRIQFWRWWACLVVRGANQRQRLTVYTSQLPDIPQGKQSEAHENGAIAPCHKQS